VTSIRPYSDPAPQSYGSGVRRRARDTVLVASAVLPLLAACGGGDGDDAGTPAAATATTVLASPTAAPTQPAPAAGLPLVVDTDLAADDIEAERARLEAAGVSFVDDVHRIHVHDGTMAPEGVEEWMTFFRDSEGNLLGLCEQRKAS